MNVNYAKVNLQIQMINFNFLLADLSVFNLGPEKRGDLIFNNIIYFYCNMILII